MPRNSSGTYTLPAGNPVAPNTLIETAWANPTMSDIASSLTDSLDRLGRGTMLAPLKLFDGTAVAPALSFNSEATTGLYRPAPGALGVTVLGLEVARFTSTGLSTLVSGAKFLPSVGIGALAALATLTASLMVSNNAAAFAGSVPPGTVTHLVGVDAANAAIAVDAVGGAPVFLGRRANGTLAAPTAPITNDVLAVFGASSYTGAAWNGATRAGMYAVSGEAQSATALGSYLRFDTTANTTVTTSEKMRLSDTGVLCLGVVPQAWSNSFRVAELNTRGLVLAGGTDSAVITQGVFNDGANWRYSGTTAFGIAKLDFFDGALVASNAPAGTSGAVVTFTERLRLNAAGNLGLGITPATFKLDIAGTGGAASSAVIRNSTSTSYAGVRLFNDINSTARTLEINYAGSAYAGAFLPGGPSGEVGAIATTGSFPLVLGTANTARATINAVGNVCIGGIPSAWGGVHQSMLEFRDTGTFIGSTTLPSLISGSNCHYDGAEWRYRKSGSGAMLQAADAGNLCYIWYTAPTGTAGNPIAFTERMRLFTDGRLDIVAGSGALRMGGHITRAVATFASIPTVGGAYSVAHGGSRVPDYCTVWLRCKIAEINYSVGDEVLLIAGLGNPVNRNYQMSCGPTQTFIWFDTAGGAPAVYNKTTGAYTVITVANWDMIAKSIWL